MSTIIVLQARTSSTRLPAKVLLPVCGVPIAVLAAKRASNTGMRVIAAIPTDASDDALADTLKLHGINFFRGSLDNTLERFVEALSEYDDNDTVIRLTADNVLPDGFLLNEIEDDFKQRNLDYLCCNGEQSGLPYGVSAEITYLKHLRKALKSTDSAFDREHVTPYIIRLYGKQYFDKYKSLKKGMYRSTIDQLDDYLHVLQVFSGIEDPVAAPLFQLLDRLYSLPDGPISTRPVTELIIGGAQLGLTYGITNSSGKPSMEESDRLIKTAIINGVSYIDTAQAYGDSEAIVGQILAQGWSSRIRVITKLSPLDDCPRGADHKTVHAFIEASIYQSCSLLRRMNLDVLMLHRASHIDGWNGLVWEKLVSLKEAGTIQRLGVSVQSPDELEYALEIPLIEFIQMPFNILDGRWEQALNLLRAAKLNRQITIHVRSIFLQGLILSEDPAHWKKANMQSHKPISEWLNSLAAKYERDGLADLCLAYVRSQTWIDGIVVGMENTSQLIENIGYFNKQRLTEEAIGKIESERPVLPEAVLNPAHWQKEQANA